MNESENASKVIEVGAIGLYSAFCGWMGWLVLLCVFCMASDYGTGTADAIKSGTWSSKIAGERLWHQFGSIVAVGVSAAVDILLGLIINNVPSVQLP